MPAAGFEPAIFRLRGERFNQLSYTGIDSVIYVRNKKLKRFINDLVLASYFID